MPVLCSAYNCKSKSCKGSKISFHRFPADADLRKRWIIATKWDKFEPSKSARLCSEHFEDEAFEPGGIRRILKKNALFNFPLNVGPSKPKHRRVLLRAQAASSPTTPGLSCQHKHNQDLSMERKIPVMSPTITLLQRKMKILQQRLKRRDQRIKTMKDLITILRTKLNAPERLLEVLEEKFSGFPLELVAHTIKIQNHSTFNVSYSEKMKEFALTVYFYSPKAFKYLRTKFVLPNPSIIRRWLSCFNSNPGFLEEVFAFLKLNIKDRPSLKKVNLVLDAMSIRKQVLYDQKQGKNTGYVTLGKILIWIIMSH